MSEKELARNLLENIPPYKLGYVIAYMQGICADENADDAFCSQLCEDYEKDPEKGQLISFNEMMKMSGVKSDEI